MFLGPIHFKHLFVAIFRNYPVQIRKSPRLVFYQVGINGEQLNYLIIMVGENISHPFYRTPLPLVSRDVLVVPRNILFVFSLPTTSGR
jgi:hypothetical protein